MKIKITNTPEGLKLASCYVGARINKDFYLVGLNRGFFTIFSKDMGYAHASQITLDLSTSQPCIYQCMKQGLKVEAYLVYGKGGFCGVGAYDLSDIETQRELLDMKSLGYIKYIEILGLEEFEGVEVVEARDE